MKSNTHTFMQSLASSTGLPEYPPACHIAMSCAPLATSRHRNGVLRGTPGGAEPPFTPTEMPCSAGATDQRRARSRVSFAGCLDTALLCLQGVLMTTCTRQLQAYGCGRCWGYGVNEGRHGWIFSSL